MAEKKKQHYVPRFYLKRFATCDKKFNLYSIERKSVIADGNSVPYKDQFYEDYFYGEDKVWENKLDDLESKWDKSFLNVIEERYRKFKRICSISIWKNVVSIKSAS